eukprot:6883259-Pyramimonas_sp.AAC.1
MAAAIGVDPSRVAVDSAGACPAARRRRRALLQVGLDTAIKPLLSRSTTGEFNSPPEYSRTISTARSSSPC